METSKSLPASFIGQRLHSLTGFFIALFLVFHLFTNSQSALYFGDEGRGFIRSVNGIHDIPYLPVLEILLLAVPILIHMIWGIKIVLTARYNSFSTDGSKPSLPNYGRNVAYTWQRITSWLLLVGLTAHIVHMRILDYPEKVVLPEKTVYLTRVSEGATVQRLANQLSVPLWFKGDRVPAFAVHQSEQLKQGELLVEAPDFGTATLFSVRSSFQDPKLIALYTLFVLIAAYHGFNGLWTFLIAWGVTLTQRSQNLTLRFCWGVMALVSLFGLMAIFGAVF